MKPTRTLGRVALPGVALLAVTAALLPGGAGHAATSGSAGQIAYVVVVDGKEEVLLADAAGTGTTNLSSSTERDIDPAWSPDGTRLAWSSGQAEEGHLDIWVMNADGTGKTNLTPGADTSGQANTGVEPTWSPDGTQIAYAYQGDVWVIPATGGQETNLMPGAGAENAGAYPAWSPDGRIAFVRNHEIWVMDADGTDPTQLTSTPHPAAERYPDWSPDGKRLVYERQGEIWRMNADGSGQAPVSAGTDKGGTRPEWSPEGDRIVFSSSGYSAPNGPDIFTARPDGTRVVRHQASTSYAEHSPAWQPLDDGMMWATYTTTAVGLKPARVRARGEVFPANTGGEVRVTLQRKTAYGYRKVASRVTTLSEYGDYGTAFDRPAAKTCRVVSTFLGSTGSRSSKDVTTFRC